MLYDDIGTGSIIKVGVAENRLGRGARVLELKKNEMPSYGLYSTNHIPS